MKLNILSVISINDTVHI